MTGATFVEANIRGAFGGMPQELVREDLVTIRDLDPLVVALQEFWLPRYNRAARKVLRPEGYRLRTPWFKSPSLAWSDALAVDGPGILEPLHPRVEGRSDPRQILAQPLTPRSIEMPFTAVSTHRAPGPWQNSHVRALVEFADRQVRSGRAVWIGADLNTYADKPLGDRIGGHPVRYVRHKVDFQIFIDSDHYGWSIDRDSKDVTPLNSDHDALTIQAQLRRRG